jgi:monoglucosyldiacylglycerol epimerase
MPGEVWAVGLEIECHPHFGNGTLQIYSASKRAYAAHARRYYRDPDLLYRHIVPSAFTSRMGPGLISGAMAVRIAMFFITRGFRYIPVTYTGIALLNAFKFILLPAAQTPSDASASAA